MCGGSIRVTLAIRRRIESTNGVSTNVASIETIAYEAFASRHTITLDRSGKVRDVRRVSKPL
jgi:hypothetical protein